MSKPLTRKERSIAAAYRRLQKAEERASAQYELADRLKFAIAQKAGGHGQVVRISSEGKALEIIDNYQAAIAHPKRGEKQMPKAWAHGSVRQFEVKEVSIPIEVGQ
jgi:hypothetical protein